jgi:hypothetical protein
VAQEATTAGGDSRLQRWFSAPFFVTLAGGAAIALTLVLIEQGRAKGNFESQPEFVIWALLLTAGLLVWFFAIFESCIYFSRADRGLLAPSDIAAVLFLGVLSVVFLAPALGMWRSGVPGMNVPLTDVPLRPALGQLPSCDEWPFAHYCSPDGFGAVTLFGAAAPLFPIAVILAIRRLLWRLPARAEGQSAITQFAALRDQLQRFLALAGASIGIAVLVFGAFQNAGESSNRVPARAAYCADLRAGGDLSPRDRRYCAGAGQPSNDQTFPDEFVLLFGLYASGILALAYAPAFLTLQRSGRDLLDRLPTTVVKPNESEAEAVLRRIDERSKLESALKLNVGTTTSFRAGAVVLTPLIGSLIALLLGH